MAKPGSVRGLFPIDILTSSTVPEKGEAADFIASLSYNGKEADILQCSKCIGQVAATRATVSVQTIFSSGSDYSVPSLYCGKCHFPFVGMHVAGEWWTVEELLTSRDSSRQGFQKVETLGERLALFVLNRIVYRCCDMDSQTDSPFLTHSTKETAKLLWVDGKAVGFYTVKLKGTLCSTFLSKVYGLDLIDTIFIRKSHRNQGYGLQLLEDILESHLEGNIGFSYPMSDSMYAVCYKYLQSHVEDRDYLWECLAPGDEIQRANIWLQLHGEKKAIAQAVEAKISLTTPVNGDMGSSDENSMEVEESAEDSVCAPADEVVTEPEQAEGSQEEDTMMEEKAEDQQEEDQTEDEEKEVPEAAGDDMGEEEMESQEEEEEEEVVPDKNEQEEEEKDEEHPEEIQEEDTADEEVVLEEAAKEEGVEEQIPEEDAVTSEEAEGEEEQVEEEQVEKENVSEAISGEEEEEEKQEDAPEVLEVNVDGMDTSGTEDAAAAVENETKDDANAAEVTVEGDEEKLEEADAELQQTEEQELVENELETEVTDKDDDAADKAGEDPDASSPVEEAGPEASVVEEGCKTTESPVEDAATDDLTTKQDDPEQEREAAEQTTKAEEVVTLGEPEAPPAEVEEEPIQYNDTTVEAEETYAEEKTEEVSQEPETAAEGNVSEKPDLSEDASTSQEGTQVQELPTEPLVCKENEASGSKDQESADSSQEDVEEVKQKRGRGRPRKNARETKTSQETEENEMFDKENTTDEELSTGKEQDTGDSSQDEETEELKKPPRRTPRGKGRKRRSKVREDEENVPSPRVSKRRKV
ncbi:soluble lamin-associated protein of 75 kDa-like isoform X2 [Branchiostoma lanceolatum]|uniref:soluble lamin-associated protein of 75 kDa-like isoform X2 n=1 Tax=Branchiostoma lanceolatum TaxID=7740 RepID=UPI0034534530